MKQQKRKRATISIRGDQYDWLLKLATVEQRHVGRPVSVGELVRRLIDEEFRK